MLGLLSHTFQHKCYMSIACTGYMRLVLFCNNNAYIYIYRGRGVKMKLGPNIQEPLSTEYLLIF